MDLSTILGEGPRCTGRRDAHSNLSVGFRLTVSCFNRMVWFKSHKALYEIQDVGTDEADEAFAEIDLVYNGL